MIERAMSKLRRRLWKLEDRLWKLKCARNRRWPLEPMARPLASYRLRGASVEMPSEAPGLCVVLITHGRPGPCARLLEDLHGALQATGQERAFVLVLNDPSERDYAPVLDILARCFPGRFAFHEASRWVGKRGMWFVYQHAFDTVARLRPVHTLFIEDDVTFDPGFVRDALALWKGIEDPAKAVLYLMSSRDDEPAGRWIRFERLPNAAGTSRLTKWFDGHASLVDGSFFRLLHGEVFRPPASRWLKQPSRSSGVFEQFTLRLFGRGNIHQVEKTLVFHGHEPSLMHPELRRLQPLDNRKERTG